MKQAARVLANEYQTPSAKESVSRTSNFERGSVKSTATGVLKELNRNVWHQEQQGTQIQSAQHGKTMSSSQKSSQVHAPRPSFYTEPEQLENLVYRKEEIIGSLEHNERVIEEKIAMLGTQ